ncbi:MAG: UDP-N-acetylmuramoyl-L-alanyl-D-glutamate--2,6-diaminopimelate ligase [Patescibacteria group bacterium]
MKSFLKKIISWRLVNLLWHLPKSVAASLLYGFPARKLIFIAVSGSKGKTSTAYFLNHILTAAGTKSALFTTAALSIAGSQELNTLKLTTPTPFFLQKFLRRALEAHCTHAVIEVSSHALKQYRVWGIPFSVVILTNLMSDHLEYHANADEYRTIHKRLITKNTSALVLNGDDQNEQAFKELPVKKIVVSKNSKDFTKLYENHLAIRGEFNIMNLCMACAAAKTLGIPEEAIHTSLTTLTNAPGRMEYIRSDKPFDCIVDYAHSPDSLRTFFSAIRPSVQGRIIAVFGACGDRDPGTRPMMGQVLDTYADIIVVTNDDTYSEDPETIAVQLMKGITQKSPETLYCILDRRSAISKALCLAQQGDTVCILGKGAEQWQIIGTAKLPWDDRLIVKDLLAQPCANTSADTDSTP